LKKNKHNKTCLKKISPNYFGLIALLFSLFFQTDCFAQCKSDYALKIQSLSGICNGDNGEDTLYVSTADTLSEIKWFSTVTPDTTVYSVVIPAVQDVTIVAGGNGMGTSLNQFDNPDNIFIDGNGYLYVVDENNNRVLKFPPGSTGLTNGVVVAGGNGPGSNANQLFYPFSVYVNASGNIYVADFANGRVQKFPPNSNSSTPGVTVAQNGLDGPSSIYMDGAGNLFVADEAGEDIIKYPPNSNANTPADTIATGLGYVFQLFVTTNGDLYVTLGDYYYVIEFPAGSTNAVVVAGNGAYGNALNELAAPTSCYVDGSGNLYVLDGVTCRVIKFPPGSMKGSYGTTVAGGNGNRFGSGANQLNDPTSVFLDNSGNIYVADDGNNRVVEYFKDGPTTTFIDSTYTIVAPDLAQPAVFYAVVTNNKGCTDTTNKITIIPSQLPSIDINSNAIDPNLCGQYTEQLTFNATIANGGANPFYQWHLNGNNVGTNSPDYTGIFSNKDVINCTLVSDVECATTPTVTSPDFVVQFHLPPSATLQEINGGCVGRDTLLINPNIYSIFKVDWNLNSNIDTVYNSRLILDTGKASIGVTIAGGNNAGDGTNQFKGPNGICLDAAGNIYVADGLNDRVLKFSPGSNSYTNGIVVAGGNGNGSNSNQLSFPTSVFVDGSGNLYVADENNNRIQKFPPGSSNSTNAITIAGGNGEGSAPNQFYAPNSIAVDKTGNIFVCDELNNRIQKFPPNSDNQTNGVTVAGGNGEGASLNQLNNPTSICLDNNNNIYVSDFDNYRVLEFFSNSSSSSSGNVVISNTSKNDANLPIQPYGVFVDNNNDIYVTNANNSHVFIFASGSQNGITVAGFHGIGDAENQLDEPYSICVNGDGDVFIADFDNYRIQKYTHFISIIDTAFVPSSSGAYTATLTDTSGCTFSTNVITIANPPPPSVSISTDSTVICYGLPLSFRASITDLTGSPEYQWQVNGVDAGTNNSIYTTDSLVTGDTVICIASNSGCPVSDTSNKISLIVNPLPLFGISTNLTINRGESTTLNIPIQNNVSSYLWSPDYALSSNTDQNPLATPLRTTTYYLQATASDDCTAIDSITVNVISKIYIPSAFTPNGDGKNDFFYVIGGMPGDVIENFTVFNRLGEKEFQIQNGIPNYTGYGWDGSFKSSPAPGGTYVYVITIKSKSGAEEVYKGTVVLIR
jgi:gliding motility-associated-like protein